MEGPDQPNPRREAMKNQLKAEIERVKPLFETASVETVAVPDGRKDVTIAYMDNGEFHEEIGTAIGVYVEPDRQNPYVVHIDWDDDSPDSDTSISRTSVVWDDIETFEESDYYIEDE